MSPVHRGKPRRGAIVVLSAFLLVALLGLAALALDLGYIVLVRTELQAAADAAALAAAGVMHKPDMIYPTADQYARYHVVSRAPVALNQSDVQVGLWDTKTRVFVPAGGNAGNSVRVTTRRDQSVNGRSPLFFARIFGQSTFEASTSAVAMVNPRDIAFVIDLSGSMNDDTEPCWASDAINSKYGDTIGDSLMADLYADLGLGPFPGPINYLGMGLVPQDKWAYAELTKNGGALSNNGVPAQYRILPNDDEATRKEKCYRAIIDYQIAPTMPAAKPTPNSATNYAFWAKYLDYILISAKVAPPPPPSPPGGGGGGGGGGGHGGGGGGGGGGPSGPSPPPIGWAPQRAGEQFAWQALTTPIMSWQGQAGPLVSLLPGAGWDQILPQLAMAAPTPGAPPVNRGTIPPDQGSDRITGFNNPNQLTFPEAEGAGKWRNWIGYRTYVQFIVDCGRDLQLDGVNYSPLSVNSPHCVWHSEETAGGAFMFPPREQPMHASRRAIIAALQVVKQRNQAIPDPAQRDWVSIITFDSISNGAAPQVVHALSSDYGAAMQACTTLQAVGDKGTSTATEAGLALAQQHIDADMGIGRPNANKVVVLLTDGVPNAYSSSASTIDNYIADNPSPDFYSDGAYWLDAPLMRAAQMSADKWEVYPVGIGLGTDYDFMDRMARAGGTADKGGMSPRGSGNPAEYEDRLTQIFEKIINNPRVRLVQ